MNKKLIISTVIFLLLLIAAVLFIGFGSGQLSILNAGRRGEDITSADDHESAAGTAGREDGATGVDSSDTAVARTTDADNAGPDNGSLNKDGSDIGAPDKAGPSKTDPDKAGPNKTGQVKSGADRYESDIDNEHPIADVKSLIDPDGSTAADRISTPDGFERLPLSEGSFGGYLRNLPLKPHGSRVQYYDGGTKPWDVHAAVVDIDVGNRDLQQCADAVIRLRAEYLYKNGNYDKIHFNFTNGFNAQYSKWIQGYRISISGNKAVWVKNGTKGTDYQSFRKYLEMVFAYAGTLSLSKEMKRIEPEEMQPGDVFLKGGSPGHCVIIIDMAENPQTGERIFLTAQSYMPAQDIHILKNPGNPDGDPWYPADFGDELVTPEWTFSRDQVYRFAD